MVTVCPVCREIVHVSAGYIVRHGARHHGVVDVCSGSSTPVCTVSDGCCF